MAGNRPTAQDANEQGLWLLRDGFLEQALACFYYALTLDPDYAATYRNRAAVLDKLGRHREASIDMQRASELEARPPIAADPPIYPDSVLSDLTQRSAPIAPIPRPPQVEPRPATPDATSAIPTAGPAQQPTAVPRASGTSAAWSRAGAFLVDMVFGYGPVYAGFMLALFAYDEELKREFVAERATELLGVVAAYLVVARLILVLWARQTHRPRAVADVPEEGGGSDRLWAWVLEVVGLVSRVLGRPLEAVLALLVFVLIKQAGNGLLPDSAGFWLATYTLSLAFYVGPWLLGFWEVWEGNGQTLGRTVFGLQLQDKDGRPAGFIRLLLRDGIVRPLSWMGIYMAFAFLLVMGVYFVWIVLPLILLLRGKAGLVLQPFVVLWRAVTGGKDTRTLQDVLSGTRVKHLST